MITLSKSGSSIVFTFENNPLYLNDGTIEAPVNSLSLTIDSSNIATFKKAASNDIFLCTSLDELDMTKEELEDWYAENAVGGSGEGVTSGEVQTMIDQSISGKADSSAVTQEISAAVSGKADSVSAVSSAEYVSSSTTINFKNIDGTVISSIDASDFIIDGMVDDVRIETISGVPYLVIDFNTASGKEDIQIPLSDIFDPSNYYTKAEVDAAVSGKADSSAVTQEISAAVSGKADTSAVTEAISAAVSGKVDTTAITTSVTSASTDSEIPSAKAVYDAIPTGSSITSGEVQTMIDQSISGKLDTAVFDIKERVISSAIVDLHDNKIDTSAVTSAITSASTNSEVAGAKAVYDALSGIGGGISSGEAQTMIDQSISGKVDTSAITTSVTSGSTDSEIPTAKAVYDAIPTGSSITIDTTLDSGSSNPVANSSLYNELRIVSSDETPLTWEEAQGYNEYETTNYPSGCTVIKFTPTYLETVVTLNFTVLSNGTNLGMVELEWDYTSWTDVRIGVDGATYTTDGAYITITFPPSAGITKLSNYGGVIQDFYWFAIENTETPLIDEVVSNKAAISGKVDTSAITTSVTSASTDSEIPSAKAVYDAIPTGGTSYSAGTNISIDTANTINCTLNLVNGGGTNSLKMKNTASSTGSDSFSIGSDGVKADGLASFAGGSYSNAKKAFSMAFGRYSITNNYGEVALGFFGKSNGSSDEPMQSSGNTLFSVGNGTANNARHNAFEIRQNGDIYITSGGTDILLQDNLGGGGISSGEVQTMIDQSISGKVDTSAVTSAITSTSTNSEVAGAKAVYDKMGGLTILKLTQQEYDALAVKDSNTLYVVV